MGIARAHRLIDLTRPLAVCAAAAMTCACAAVPNVNVLGTPGIDSTSPIAKQVDQASRMETAYPRFTDIPQTPTDVRPVRAWSRSIYDTLRLRRQLIIAAAVAGPAPTDTEAFAQGLRNSTTAPGSPPAVTAAQAGQGTGAFVQGARGRATPPSSAR